MLIEEVCLLKQLLLLKLRQLLLLGRLQLLLVLTRSKGAARVAQGGGGGRCRSRSCRRTVRRGRNGRRGGHCCGSSASGLLCKRTERVVVMGVNRARTGGGAGVRPGHGDAGHSSAKEVVLLLK